MFLVHFSIIHLQACGNVSSGYIACYLTKCQLEDAVLCPAEHSEPARREKQDALLAGCRVHVGVGVCVCE